MIGLGLLLLGAAVADLTRWQQPCPPWRHVLGTVTAGVVAAGVLSLGGVDPATVAAYTGLVTVLTGGWVVATASIDANARAAPGLFVTGVLVVTGVAISGSDPTLGGPLKRWFLGLAESPLTEVTLDQAVVVVGAALFLTAPANTVVRLLLKAAGSRPADGERRLKGGRVLGPMERLFIFGLGLAGELTAASVIVAAKGLLRFPELQSFRDSRGGGSPRGGEDRRGIDVLTEYFLLGSMASWLLALVMLLVAAPAA